MARLRVPSALQLTLLAFTSCTPTQPIADAAADVMSAADTGPFDTSTDTAVDTAPDDVPTSCDSMPFVGYCYPSQASSGTVCRPSRSCDSSGCSAGCTYCAFPIECHRATDGTLCLTTCSTDQCPPGCDLVA